MTPPAPFATGDHVLHIPALGATSLGTGTVTGSWGVWLACRICHGQIIRKDEACPHCGTGLPDSFESGPRHFEVSGKGIFEVYFPSTKQTECINMRWLKLVRAKAKPVRPNLSELGLNRTGAAVVSDCA